MPHIHFLHGDVTGKTARAAVTDGQNVSDNTFGRPSYCVFSLGPELV